MKPSRNLLIEALRPTKQGFVTAIVFSFFINLLVFVGPLYMLQVYDRVITSRNVTTLVAISLIACFLLVVYALLEKLRSAVMVRIGIVFASIARGPLFRAVLRGTLAQPGGGHSQALRDLDSIREFMTGAGFIALCDAPWMPIFVAGCFLLHPWYGFISLGGAVLIFTFAVANDLLTRKQLQQASVNSIAAGTYASATFRNAEVLKAMGMLSGLQRRWLDRQNDVLTLQASASDRAGHLVAASKFLRAFLQIAILGTGAYLCIIQASTPGAMIAASIIMGRALAPVEMAVANWKGFIAARSAFDRIGRLMQLAPEPPPRMSLPAPKGAMSVENAVAGAPGSKTPIIRGLSFSLKAGESMAVVGPSAAGKSTLARLLVGVWPVAAGSVRIDGADLGHWDPELLGKHIGYLPQDVELFSGSIAENISRFGDVNDLLVVAAAQLAGVHGMIQGMPDGYNTQIGEGGHALSGGQRQRIGLARALYNEPKVIVLDEPNASLDSEGEVALLSALKQMQAAQSTVIMITHKTNILVTMDKILVLTNGVMQSFGTRDEILSKLTGSRPAPTAVAS